MSSSLGQLKIRRVESPDARQTCRSSYKARYVEAQNYAVRHQKRSYSHAEIVEVEIGGVAIYRPFGEFRRAKIVLSPVWCSRPTTGVPLAHARMNFVGLDLTTSDRWH
ncbi:hypothetical protein TNCV_2437941 [Trichonephila clavipes]|nr:hypothetical protein TNCV_2437941 [Trichonephila clavipes]